MPIGSAMSFRVNAYKKAGGFKVKNAGEDFYTMQQIKKIGIICSWLGNTIYPSARISDRVVFGTGPAIGLNLENQIKKYPFYPTFLFKKIKLKQQVFRKLGAFSAMAFTSALLFPITQIIIRSSIIEKISLQSAGIWEGMNRLSGMYLMVVTTSISTYYLPRRSGIKENMGLRVEIFKTAKFVLPT